MVEARLYVCGCESVLKKNEVNNCVLLPKWDKQTLVETAQTITKIKLREGMNGLDKTVPICV